MNKHTSKCHFCVVCDGEGCIGELPGMGGIRDNINFLLNCAAWKKLSFPLDYSPDKPLPPIRLAPVTGAIENVGYEIEEDFYFDIIEAVAEAGIKLSIGDGCPDIKLQMGIRAVQKRQLTHPDTKAAVFIKPYENERIFQRLEWSFSIAEIIGIDIDAYNIVTMRNLVKLEKKTADQLNALKKNLHIPFAIKGIFNPEEVDLVSKVKPDIVVVSNHGGRVENRIGSTADFLVEYGSILRKNCGQLWVDGGIRNLRDIQLASAYGADEVMIGRPFITALCAGGKEKVIQLAKEIIT